MKLYFFLFLFFFGLSFSVSAQNTQVEIAAGVDLGWWLHQYGDSTGDGLNDLGVAKTHHSPAPFVQVNWLWQIKKWRIGPTVQGAFFIEDDMRGPSDSRTRYHRIRIAEQDKAIPMLRYGIHAEYQLLNRGRYTFAPTFRYGGFQWSTLHPNRENFGYQQFGEVVFNHIWNLGKQDLLLRMSYSTLSIFLKEKANDAEEHNLFFWGISLGMRF